MKKLFLILLLPAVLYSQRIGEMAPEKPSEIFPDNSWGVDIMFGEGGFGLGTFLRHSFNHDLMAFADFSISESKDDKEIEYIDYWGRTIVPNKINRVFAMPLNFGLQYRLFRKSITDNLRPYVSVAAGPSFMVTTPYEEEFFSAFGRAKMHYGVGGYIGFGADFGLNKRNLIGLNMRYQGTYLPGDGIESLIGRTYDYFGAFFITLKLGIMY